MYVTPSSYGKVFEDIRASSMSHTTCKLVIFISCLDIDALCASKILSNLLKSELIPHKIVPIVGYEELKSMYIELDYEISNVMLLGCGGGVDLEEYFEIEDVINEEGDIISQNTPRKIYVIDGHRPWNLDNLFGSEKIICLDDGSIDDELIKHKEAYAGLIELNDIEFDEEDKSDENSDGLTDDDNNDDGDIDEPRRGMRPLKSRAELEAETDKYTALLEEYYAAGSSYAAPVSSNLYTLLSSIGETSVANLWLTIVGTMSLDAEYPHVFKRIYPLLEDEVSRINASSMIAAHDSGNDTTLTTEIDYSLFLLRHWSLYESMLHSSYLSAKLHLWTDDGRKKMHKMLAKMGISLQESKEMWTHMHIKLKRELQSKLEGVMGSHGIDQVIRKGVVRKFGFKVSVSAGDTVEALTALLESGRTNIGLDMTLFSNNRTNDDEDQESEDINHSDEKERFWVANFWSGWDALDNINILMDGLQKAKFLQQAVVRTGTALFEKRQIKHLRVFRLAVIKEGPDLDIFKNPLALTRLAVWIADNCVEADQQSLPLVLASLDPKTNTYLVLGLGARKVKRSEDDSENIVFNADAVTNKFGSAFREVAQNINARVRLDAFESSTIEVLQDDLSRFLEGLTLSGLIGR
ncbi:CDC45-like protein [Nadsonia fulvescens var. elongata DSM 6958]|uniref:CDC45-like protein n=1 Tax=Nadsonia fulvescens var. elongata DSM 6958 TaxID=857566 RepID=A0A1E3PFM6_9ASCO|nr:CDC45-like protein [Nadsonia fulvescens var. elongata DSM 6958]